MKLETIPAKAGIFLEVVSKPHSGYRLLQSPCFEEVAMVGAASVPLRHIFCVRCQEFNDLGIKGFRN
jgi:hypothetical protein